MDSPASSPASPIRLSFPQPIAVRDHAVFRHRSDISSLEKIQHRWTALNDTLRSFAVNLIQVCGHSPGKESELVVSDVERCANMITDDEELITRSSSSNSIVYPSSTTPALSTPSLSTPSPLLPEINTDVPIQIPSSPISSPRPAESAFISLIGWVASPTIFAATRVSALTEALLVWHLRLRRELGRELTGTDRARKKGRGGGRERGEEEREEEKEVEREEEEEREVEGEEERGDEEDEIVGVKEDQTFFRLDEFVADLNREFGTTPAPIDVSTVVCDPIPDQIRQIVHFPTPDPDLIEVIRILRDQFWPFWDLSTIGTLTCLNSRFHHLLEDPTLWRQLLMRHISNNQSGNNEGIRNDEEMANNENMELPSFEICPNAEYAVVLGLAPLSQGKLRVLQELERVADERVNLLEDRMTLLRDIQSFRQELLDLIGSNRSSDALPYLETLLHSRPDRSAELSQLTKKLKPQALRQMDLIHQSLIANKKRLNPSNLEEGREFNDMHA